MHVGLQYRCRNHVTPVCKEYRRFEQVKGLALGKLTHHAALLTLPVPLVTLAVVTVTGDAKLKMT